MRKLVFILIAFIAVATFLRAFDGKPSATPESRVTPSELSSNKK